MRSRAVFCAEKWAMRTSKFALPEYCAGYGAKDLMASMVLPMSHSCFWTHTASMT